MPVTPITPAQIDEVGKGASSETTGLSPIGHAPTGHEPAAVDPSRSARLKWLSDAATQGEWWEDTYPEYDEDGGPTVDRIEGVGAMERGEPESIVQCSERNARFIVALVNAYRAGELVPTFTAANPSGGMGNVTGASLDAWELAEERKRADLFVSKLNEAEGYATRLARSLSDKHFPNPDWRPLPDLYGVLTQIDNMTTGMSRKSDPPSVSDRSGEAVETTGSTEGKSTADLSATPEATPSLPPPPSPRKGQEENPCPMTVEGIALIKDALIQARGALRLDAMTDEAGKPFGTTTVAQEAIGLALSTIRASEEDR